MNKQYLLKMSGLAALTLLLLSPAFAQDEPHEEDKDTTMGKGRSSDEIIIRPKNDKDVKVTVEVRDGQVFVNGKPVAEFNDDNVSVRKKKVIKGNAFYFSEPGEIDLGDLKELEGPASISIAPSPFRNHGGVTSIDARPNRAFLGVTSEKPEKGPSGAEVKEISPNSAAAKAGLQAGDLITKVDDMKIEDPTSLSEAVHKYKPQDKVTVTYIRNGKEAKATATLGKSMQYNFNRVYDFNYDNPQQKAFKFKQMIPPPGAYDYPGLAWGGDEKPRLGIKAQDTEDGKGVKVLEVGDESIAEKAGIKEGDIITSFDGKEVNSAVTLAELAKDSKGKPSVKIGVSREGKAKEIEVKIPKKLKTANL